MNEDVQESPEVVLLRALQKVERIKSIALVIEWDDGVECEWSPMSMRDLSYLSACLQSVCSEWVRTSFKIPET